MIGIYNIKVNEDSCTYEVRINRDLICHFEHDRKDGLAVCLEKAAKAVRQKGEGDGTEA